MPPSTAAPLPASAPSAPVPSSPSPSPSPTPAASPSAPAPQPAGGDDADFASIDAAFRADGWTRDTDAVSPPDKPVATPAQAAPDKTPPRAPDGKFTPTPAPTTAKPEPAGPKPLRDELERTKGELKAASEARLALEARIKDAESKGKDTEALLAKLDAREKEYAALQGEIRALKQEASPEFKKQYDEPFARAAKYAERVIKSLTKADGTAASFDTDFAPLYRMNYSAALTAAKEVFGDEMAPVVMQQVAELQRLDFQRQEAFEEEKKGWAEKAKVEEGRKVQDRETRANLWKRVNEDLQKTVPEYQDPPDDKEAVAARQEGYKLFDYQPKSVAEELRKGAHIRHRIAAYGVQHLQIARLNAQLASAKAEIEALKPRQPNPDGRNPGGPETAGKEVSWDDELRRISKS